MLGSRSLRQTRHSVADVADLMNVGFLQDATSGLAIAGKGYAEIESRVSRESTP